ncbi:MAG: phospho-N-acetylmuramoyl-pentapeptide-transferase [Bacteroidales bacterium]|jgi:phospho-N-acetylmuramoyl-pentapeptide-transferase|nr:phospho-N-acetylmuramoyl-pentapeptide-transferase [Bacteroidales bacterium]
MLYHLFDYLKDIWNIPGARLFQYISFRSTMAFVMSLTIAMIFGKKIILLLKKKQIGETIRNLGLEGENKKVGTPTMGGLIIMAAILVSVLCFAQLDNFYIILMLTTTIWLGAMGFIDDYIKVFKHNKDGLSEKFKITGQVILGIIVGLTIWHFTDSLKTTIPFVKGNELDYRWFFSFLESEHWGIYAWIFFVVLVTFIITAVSNGANLTDGLDGLCAGTSAVIGLALGLLAWVSGNVIMADYLNIMYLPNTGELMVFMSAFVGAMIGFLWYNTFPAQIFMGDTGSLMVGGIIAVFAILIRKELLIPLLCGVFLIETVSVIIQRTWFKITKKRYGAGHRVFLMTPIHHHFQKKGMAEAKIVTRFIIVSILLAALTLLTLKLR